MLRCDVDLLFVIRSNYGFDYLFIGRVEEIILYLIVRNWLYLICDFDGMIGFSVIFYVEVIELDIVNCFRWRGFEGWFLFILVRRKLVNGGKDGLERLIEYFIFKEKISLDI